MGIGRQTMKTSIAAVKAGTTRAQLRAQIAEMVNAGNELLAKLDAQDAGATAIFAASKQAQFNTFKDGLPPVELDPDPVDPV